MADYFVTHRKWIALAILTSGGAAAWWSSYHKPHTAAPPAGEPIVWQDMPLEPAAAQPAWAVPSAIVGQVPSPAVASPVAPQNPLEAPFPADDGARPPALGTNYPAAQPPAPTRAFRPEATRRTLLPEFAGDDAASETLHIVRDGDTLPVLAEQYLGDAAQAEAIFVANRDRLSDPEVLPIGLELRIPSRHRAQPAEPAAWPVAAPAQDPADAPPALPQPPLDDVRAQTALAPLNSGMLRRDVPSLTAPQPLPTVASALPIAPTSQPSPHAGSSPTPPSPQAALPPLPAPRQPTAQPNAAPTAVQPPIAALGAPAAAAAGPARQHVVRRGDTLRGIARDYYGDAGRWKDIFAANRAALRDPDHLAVGATLLIP